MRKKPFPRCDVCSARGPGGPCRPRSGTAGRFSGHRVAQVFARGQSLFHEGGPAHSLFILHTGRVRVFRTWSTGEEQVLRILGPGEIIGFRPIFADETYGASADALEESSLCIVPRTAVIERIRQDPELALELLAKLSRELRISEDLLMDLMRRPVRERAARLILGLVEGAGAANGASSAVATPIPRKDLARMIGTTPETFSRVLRGFADRGIVEVTRARIVVRNAALLRRVAGEHDAG